MPLRWGIDVKTPTQVKGHDGWMPVMENEMARLTFVSDVAAAKKYFEMLQGNARLELRIVSWISDDPTYSV